MTSQNMLNEEQINNQASLLAEEEKFTRLQRKLRDYLYEELIPLEKRLKLGYEDVVTREFVKEIWQRSRSLGLYGVQLPESLGGQGLSIEEFCQLKENVAASGAILFPHVLGDWGGPSRIGSLVKYATPYHMENFIYPVIAGRKGTCFAMTEPQSGSDATSLQTVAIQEGDHFRISGVKHYITASVFADFAITMCVTSPEAGIDGISAILVNLDQPGVTLKHDCVPMTGQFIDADIIFDDVRVPKENLIGGLGQGFRIAMNRVSVNRLLHCPTMLGLAEKAYQMSIEYATTRMQFGQPISRFQAIQHMLANMATELYACRQMILATARKADKGHDIRTEASMCKLFVSEACFRVADQAMQIHGNVGVTKNHPVEFIFRRLRLYRIVTGTSEIQRNTIAKGILPSKD